MLQDQYKDSSKIESEYKKLLQAWDNELSNHPSTDIKKLKISRSEHIQFTLMHLFNGYLDKIWTDSKNMLQCAQAFTYQNIEDYPSETIFTMNIIGLHLMKQSIRTRQEFFRIVDELDGIPYLNDEDQSVFSSSDSTISEDFTISHPTAYNHTYLDLEKENIQDDQNIHNNSYNLTFSEPLYVKEYPVAQSLADSEALNNFDVFIQLTSPPSTPTMSKNQSDTSTTYQHNLYDEQSSSNRKCNQKCRDFQEPLLQKNSFSFDNFQLLQYNSVQISHEDESTHEDSRDFEIASYYYNSESDNEEDIAQREFLLTKPTIPMHNKILASKRSFIVNPLIAREGESYCGSESSSIIHYDIETKKIIKNKVQRNKMHPRYDSYSTCMPHLACSSVYSKGYELDSESGKEVDDPKRSGSESELDTKHLYSRRANKFASFVKRPSLKSNEKRRENNTSALKSCLYSKSRFNMRNFFLWKRGKSATTAPSS